MQGIKGSYPHETAKSRCYVLETGVTKHKMDAKTVNERYRSLQMVERNFRTLTNGFLELRPIFVRKEERTEGHALCLQDPYIRSCLL